MSNTTMLTIRINGKEVEHTLSGLGKEIGIVRKELRDLNASDPNFKKKQAELQKQLTETSKEYDNVKKSIYGANTATDKYSRSVDNSSKSTKLLLDTLKGVGAGIVAAFSIDKVLELSRLLLENVERTRELKKELASITGLDGSQLSAATTGTSAIAQTYKKDEKEIMISANNMSKTMSITYGEALEELKRGFKEGADASGDMLEQVKEYAPFIKEAGGEAKDLVNIIKSGVVDGVYNDKAIDAVKEGLLRIREMTPATRDAITNLGIDVNDMLDKIKNGQMSYMDAMLLVSKEMDKLGNKSTVTGQALADIFGGPGEDAGFKYISNLYKMNDGISKLTKTQQEYNRIKDLELEANEKSAVLFEQLTGAGSTYAEMMAEMKLAAVEFTAALFGIKEATPADDILNEATAVKMLENELFRGNTTAERRNEILNELEQIYPNIFEGINTETASNDELKKAIDGVSDSLMKRYAIQQEQDIFDEISKKAGDVEAKLIRSTTAMEQSLSVLMAKGNIKFTPEISTKEPLEQAKWLIKEIDNNFSNLKSDEWLDLRNQVASVLMLQKESSNLADELQRAADNVLNMQNRLNKTSLTPLQKQANDFLSSQLSSFQKIIADGQKSQQTSNADSGRADEIKRQAKEAADARKQAQREAENIAKRIKDERIRETKSLHDALIKEQEAFAKKIKEAVFNEKQDDIDLLKAGLEKELDQQKLNSEKKIFAVNEEIAQLTKLREDYVKKAKTLEKAASNAGKDEDKGQYLADAKKYRDLAEKQIELVGYKNATIKALNEKSTAEQLTIYSKYRIKDLESRQKTNDDIFTALQILHNNEMASVTSVEDAKKILSEKYGVTELNHIKTIGDAKQELQKAQAKEELEAKLTVFKQEQEEMQSLLKADTFNRENGLINILNDEDRDKLIENLKAAGVAISEIDAMLTGNKTDDADKKAAKEENAKSQLRSGINLLAFSAEDWHQAFEQLDTAGTEVEKFAAKIKLVEMALQTAMTAWSMLSESQNKALDRNLKKYEQSNEARKKSLQKQLDEGVISQASYNAQVEALDEALAAKRAEIEYKKAMADWKMNLVSGQMNTALGITAALASSPPPYSYILAGITGAMGLAQLAIMMANKPQKSSFYNTGGPTIGLGYTDETGEEVAGTVHANEYVVPEWLRADPVVAKMEEFIEAKRLGRSPSLIDYPTKYATGGEVKEVSSVPVPITSIDNNLIQLLINYVENGNELLAKLIIEGVKLSRTMEGAKQLSEDIEKYKSLMNKSKKS